MKRTAARQPLAPRRNIRLSSPAKGLYAALFAALFGIPLAAWARATADIVRLPAVTSWPVGLAAASSGILLLLLGPGIFRLLPHPIYTGFPMLCVGISIAAGSASGLWLISPIVALGCAALALGYERRHRNERFDANPGVRWPAAGASSPAGLERVACYLFVLLPWLVMYEAVVAMGTPPDAVSGALPFEQRLPVLEWPEIFYFSTYALTALAPLFARTRSDLRAFSARGLAAMLVAFPLYLALPLIAPPRPFTPHTVLGRLLLWDRGLDSPGAAFPSFHVIWAVLTAQVFSRRWPRLAWLFNGWALMVAASCIATGQHSLIDVGGGAATVWLVVRGPALWRAVRTQAHRSGNARREWRMGPVRFFNGGIYFFAGASVGMWIAISVAGPGQQAPVLVSAGLIVMGAVLWAGFVDGALRFYGGVLGGLLGALSAPLFGTSPWLALAALSVGGGWAQAIGRLGYRLTARTGAPLPATPVYFILWDGLVALAVTRLWTLSAPLRLIAGIYFILTGLGRFVEARGEARTPMLWGQRAAAASVIGGALITALGDSAPAPAPLFAWHPLLSALVFGLAGAMATGVDFPNWQRRFSRLV